MNAIKQIKIKKPNQLSAFFICLLIATVLWLLHSLNTVYTKQFVVPVEFVNYPLNKVAVSEIPKEINVTVKASGLKLLFIGINEPFTKVTVDFNETKSDLNRNRYYLSSNTGGFQKLFKFKTDIKQVYPDTIAFVSKAGTQKEVFVKVPLYVKYALGYIGSEIKTEPSMVMINGEESDLKSIDTVYTAPVYLNDLKTNYSKRISILNANSKLYINNSSVDFTIKVDKLVERIVTLSLGTTNADPQLNYALFPNKIKVKITTGLDRLTELDTAQFKAKVDVGSKNTGKLPVSISVLPEGVHVMSIEPKEVEILKIKKK